MQTAERGEAEARGVRAHMHTHIHMCGLPFHFTPTHMHAQTHTVCMPSRCCIACRTLSLRFVFLVLFNTHEHTHTHTHTHTHAHTHAHTRTHARMLHAPACPGTASAPPPAAPPASRGRAWRWRTACGQRGQGGQGQGGGTHQALGFALQMQAGTLRYALHNVATPTDARMHPVRRTGYETYTKGACTQLH